MLDVATQLLGLPEIGFGHPSMDLLLVLLGVLWLFSDVVIVVVDVSPPSGDVIVVSSSAIEFCTNGNNVAVVDAVKARNALRLYPPRRWSEEGVLWAFCQKNMIVSILYGIWENLVFSMVCEERTNAVTSISFLEVECFIGMVVAVLDLDTKAWQDAERSDTATAATNNLCDVISSSEK